MSQLDVSAAVRTSADRAAGAAAPELVDVHGYVGNESATL
jgi:hypothetical protein